MVAECITIGTRGHMPGFRGPFEGIIQVRTIPTSWNDEEFAYLWAPTWELDDRGKLYKAKEPRLSIEERERRFPVEYETHNLLMNGAFTQILTYCSVATASTAQNFFQFLAIGTGAITGVARTDTTLATETFRKAPASYNPVGTQSTISTNLLSTDAVSTWSNMGIYGNGASSTLNSGSLFSHALASYVKGSTAIVVDYIIVLSN